VGGGRRGWEGVGLGMSAEFRNTDHILWLKRCGLY
jgi:hypothetical protein